MFSHWPSFPTFTTSAYPQTYQSAPQVHQTHGPYYTVSASLEYNGQEYMNQHQVESILLGSWVPPSETSNQIVRHSDTYATHSFAPIFADPLNPATQYTEVATVETYPAVQPPATIYTAPLEIRRKLPDDRAQTILYPRRKPEPSPAATQGDQPAVSSGQLAQVQTTQNSQNNTLLISAASSKPNQRAPRMETLREERVEQDLTEQLRELREALDKEARDHAAAMAQLRGARMHACTRAYAHAHQPTQSDYLASQASSSPSRLHSSFRPSTYPRPIPDPTLALHLAQKHTLTACLSLTLARSSTHAADTRAEAEALEREEAVLAVECFRLRRRLRGSSPPPPEAGVRT
jgi:hypothetical protein